MALIQPHSKSLLDLIQKRTFNTPNPHTDPISNNCNYSHYKTCNSSSPGCILVPSTPNTGSLRCTLAPPPHSAPYTLHNTMDGPHILDMASRYSLSRETQNHPRNHPSLALCTPDTAPSDRCHYCSLSLHTQYTANPATDT